RARIVAMFQSAVPISGVVGGPLSGCILDHFSGQFHYQGWQWLFVIESLPAIILAVAVWLYLDNGIAEAHWLTAPQKNALVRAMVDENATKERLGLREILADARVWRLSLLALGLVIGVYAVSFWLPTLLSEAGARSRSQVGWLSAIPNLVAVPTMLVFA